MHRNGQTGSVCRVGCIAVGRWRSLARTGFRLWLLAATGELVQATPLNRVIFRPCLLRSWPEIRSFKEDWRSYSSAIECSEFR
jgi:hypothetical protein